MAAGLRAIGDGAYHLIWGHALNATPNNLQWALRQTDVLQYTFQDGRETYSILEYAVKSADTEATRTLLELGATVESSRTCSMGTMVHFYMHCLREDTPPNLDILNLLLDKLPDINVEEAGYFCTVLEEALKAMGSFKQIHWNVIETLLARGVRVTDVNGTSPFSILLHAHDHKITYGFDRRSPLMLRSAEEEKTFLANLATYVILEKKYYPDSPSGLTLKEFEFHTSHLLMAFATTQSNIAISAASKSSYFDEEEGKLSIDYLRFAGTIVSYNFAFNVLVQDASFKDYFIPGRMELFISLIKQTSRTPQAEILLGFLRQCGFNETAGPSYEGTKKQRTD